MVKGDSMAGLQTYTTFMISKACAKYFHLIIYKRWDRNERIPQKNCKFAHETIIIIIMTEIQKQYRLTSTEEPTDEMLQALMEDVAAEARKSMARAEAEKKRRLQAVADEIAAWRAAQ